MEDPIVVNTVSNVTVSVEKATFSAVSSLNLGGFLHDVKPVNIIKTNIQIYLCIICCDIYFYEEDECLLYSFEIFFPALIFESVGTYVL